MKYLKSFAFCFFIVFFVNYLIPGVDVVSFTKIPFFKGDILFPAVLALANIGIVLGFKMVGKALSKIKLGLSLFVLNSIGYSFLKVANSGIYITTVEGYALSIILVSVGCFLVLSFLMHDSSSGNNSGDEKSHKEMFGDF